MGTLANETREKFLSFVSKYALGITLVFIIVMLVIPFPNFLVDIFMTSNLLFSIILLLTVLYTPRASSLSSFPQIVLLFTIYGIGINVASTRLILTADGTKGLAALSQNQSAMVQAFANIVANDNIVIGFVIFIIFIVVQVLVITKGAGRVSEVAARFTLDSMSTKQFDIDNQLSQGSITEEEARIQKEQLRRDIDFYSNMDGASKFVSGNVTAGIFITVINLVGGFLVGMLQYKLSWTDALNLYSKLTIGDGLLSQLPSLLLSFSTGLLVTGDKSNENLGEKISKEFTVESRIFTIAGTVLLLMAIAFHNKTALFLIPIGGLVIFYGYNLTKKKEKDAIKKAQEEQKAREQSMQVKNNPESDSVSPLDPLQLQIGYALIPLVDKEKGAELLERITRIRKECANEMGLPVPRIRIIDNMSLDPNVYSFQIRGIEVASSTIRLGYYMCMNTGSVTEEIAGEKTKDPAFGMPAIWVPEENRSEAEQAGYAVVDPPTLIATHITEVIRAHAAEILGRQEVETLINSVKEQNPIVVNEVLHGEQRKFSYGDIEKVLQGLLREQVSIRNMVTILETLANFGSISSDPYFLTEKVREALGVQICLQYADSDKHLRVINLGQDWVNLISENIHIPQDGSAPFVGFDLETGRQWTKCVSEKIAQTRSLGYMPIILAAHQIRPYVHYLLESEMSGVVVLSDSEVLKAGKSIQLEVLGEISMGNEETVVNG